MDVTPSLSGGTTSSRFGALLKEWRRGRRMSQLAIALEAEVSARHLCYIENARARPSREMVARLAASLGLSLRERNDLLVAAGYAPEFPESGLPAESSTC